MSKSRLATVIALGLITLGLVVGIALATPPSAGLTSTPLIRATLGKFRARHHGIGVRIRRPSADVAVTRLTFKPGSSASWHHHPGVLLIAVKSGAVTHYKRHCTRRSSQLARVLWKPVKRRFWYETMGGSKPWSTSPSLFPPERPTPDCGLTTLSRRLLEQLELQPEQQLLEQLELQLELQPEQQLLEQLQLQLELQPEQQLELGN
jgi:hypothetical protein